MERAGETRAGCETTPCVARWGDCVTPARPAESLPKTHCALPGCAGPTNVGSGESCQKVAPCPPPVPRHLPLLGEFASCPVTAARAESTDGARGHAGHWHTALSSSQAAGRTAGSQPALPGQLSTFDRGGRVPLQGCSSTCSVLACLAAAQLGPLMFLRSLESRLPPPIDLRVWASSSRCAASHSSWHCSCSQCFPSEAAAPQLQHICMCKRERSRGSVSG